MEILKQDENDPMPVEKQIISIYTATRGYLDDIPVEDVLRFESELLSFVDAERADLLQKIREQKTLSEEIEEGIKKAIQDFKKGFAPSNQ